MEFEKNTAVCAVCGKEFSYDWKRRKTCGSACRVAHQAATLRAMANTPAKCKVCGKSFAKRTSSQVYCTNACRSVADSKRYAAKIAEQITPEVIVQQTQHIKAKIVQKYEEPVEAASDKPINLYKAVHERAKKFAGAKF